MAVAKSPINLTEQHEAIWSVARGQLQALIDTGDTVIYLARSEGDEQWIDLRIGAAPILPVFIFS